MKNILYLDNAATTKVREEVLKEMLPFFNINFGNPSSIYSIGRLSKKKIEEAREKIAKVINAQPKEIYFTGCGSESDNIAIKGIAYANKENGKNHIITSKIEHPAVLNTCKALEKEGFKVTYLNVDNEGIVNLGELKNSINEKTILISIMYANNEIGVVQQIEEIGLLAKEHNVYFHTDGVQAVGSEKIDVNKMNIDLLSMSAHKFYGPKGIGALYVKSEIEFKKLQDGGHQEKDKRAGTENVAGIVGMGKAIELAYENLEKNNNKILELREYCISQIEEKIPNIKINGHRSKRLVGNINISFENINGGELLLKLDEKGICASAGSACSSGESKPSHVLLAIGLPKNMLDGALRITLGKDNTKEEIDFFVKSLVDIIV